MKEYFRNSESRYIILEDVLKAEIQKWQMKLVKQKNKKLEKQLRGITPNQMEQTIRRYLRFCKD